MEVNIFRFEEGSLTRYAQGIDKWGWLRGKPFDSLAARLRRAARSLRAFDQSNGSP
jgi:hypothetical protein